MPRESNVSPYPAVKTYFDVDGIRRAYLTCDLSRPAPLPRLVPAATWGVESAAGAGWGSSSDRLACFSVRQPGWLDFHPSLAVPVSSGR